MPAIEVYGVVNDEMVEEVKQGIHAARKDDFLEVRISSPGGSLGNGVTIYNRLRDAPQKKAVFIDGDCFSAASLIASAGDTVEMHSNCLMMIHDPWLYGLAPVTIDEAEKTLRYLKATKKQAIEIYREKTNLGPRKLSELMKDETYFDAQEALDHGFIDNISGPTHVQNLKLDKYPVRDRDKLARLLAQRPVPVSFDERMHRIQSRAAQYQLAKEATHE